ncbi:MAG: ATP-binding protein [Candidatus Brocadiia bacterium]
MPNELPRSPSFVVVIGDAARDRLDALQDRRGSIQSHILEARGTEDAVNRVLAARPDLVAVPENPEGRSHLELCRRVKELNPRIATLVLRERLDAIPPGHPDVDDYAALGNSDEMMARINVLLGLKTYNARAAPIRERVLDSFRAFELSPELLADGRLLPPSRVSYEALLDMELIHDLQAALSRLGDTAFACYPYAAEPRCVLSGGRDGCLRGVCPVEQALSGRPGFGHATEECELAAWHCARDAMLGRSLNDTLCPGGYRLAAAPVLLRFRGVSYPLLGLCIALPSPIDLEQLDRLARQMGVDPEPLRREVQRHPLPELARVHTEAILRIQESVGDAISRQVSQSYATAYNVLVKAVEGWENDRALTRRSLQLQHANERLRQLNRLKREFLANVSHELKTPMTSIIGFTSLLLRGGAGPLSEKGERFLNRVLANARTLHAAINDILDMAHLDSRDVRLSIGVFPLRPLIEECLDQVRPLLTEKPIELQVDVAEESRELNTDRERLGQVLLSLLRNAAKFTQRGTIRVAARPAPDGRLPRVAISVADTGVGLPTEALPHIFEQFRQVDGSSTRAHGGAGLGLALVKKLTSLLGGQVTVRSELDEGSTFTVTIPADLPRFQEQRQRLAEQALAGEPDPADRSGPIVLAVGYQPQEVLDMRRWCEPHGYRVASAFGAEGAFQRARDLLPFAILVNVLAPGHEVWAFTDELRADPRTTDVPLLVSSALGGGEVAEAVAAADWLPRPLGPDPLLNALDLLRPEATGSALVIAGDDSLRNRLRQALRRGGLRVVACATCRQALRYADTAFDALVVDPAAEGEGELTAQGTLRTGPWAQAPTVVYVGRGLARGERERLEAQAKTVLEQGEASPTEVAQAVARLLRPPDGPGADSHSD